MIITTSTNMASTVLAFELVPFFVVVNGAVKEELVEETSPQSGNATDWKEKSAAYRCVIV